MLFDTEGYFFSISGGWKKVLKTGPYKQTVANREVRLRTNREDWKDKDLYIRKAKKIHWWEKVDWERIRRYWSWRWDCFKGLFKKIYHVFSPKPVDIPLH